MMQCYQTRSFQTWILIVLYSPCSFGVCSPSFWFHMHLININGSSDEGTVLLFLSKLKMQILDQQWCRRYNDDNDFQHSLLAMTNRLHYHVFRFNRKRGSKSFYYFETCPIGLIQYNVVPPIRQPSAIVYKYKP